MFEFSGPSDQVAASSQSHIDSLPQRFDRLWQSNDPPAIDDFLNLHTGSKRELLIELVYVDLEYRLARDRSTRVERYFNRYSELWEDREVALELIVQEYRLRSQQEELEAVEYLRRFPEFETELREGLKESDVVLGDFSGLLSRIERFLGQARSDRADATPVPGDFLGRYEVQREIGRGAFGIVYKALDTQLKRTVAIKMAHAAVLTSPRAIDRRLREARHAARLKHPSIVPILDVGIGADSIYLVSAFIAGDTLYETLQRSEYSETTAVRLLADVADALHFAHEQGVIHRDVKPSNLILDDQGKPHLTDFGLSRSDEDTSVLTLDGETLGTPAYLSPEQAMGHAHRVDARTDVYSLGVVMYQLLTGRLPFQGDSRAIVHKVIHEETTPVRRLCPHVPRDLETVCMKAMAKEPSHRFESAEEMALELKRFLRGEPMRSRPIGAVTRLVRWCRRKPVFSSTIACSALTVVLAVGAVIWNVNRTRQYRESAQQHRQDSIEASILARDMVDQMFRQLETGSRQRTEAVATREQLALEAEKYFREVAQMRREDPAAQTLLADAVYRVGSMNLATGANVDAWRRFSEAKQHWQQLFEQNPNEDEFQYRVVKACQRLAVSQIRIGEYDEAGKSIVLAVQLAEDLVERFPRDTYYRGRLADVYRGLAGLRDMTGPFEAKRDAMIKAKDQLEQLVRSDSSHTGYRRRLAESYRGIGALNRTVGMGSLLSLEERDVSLYDVQMLDRARAIQQELLDQDQEMPWVATDLEQTLSSLAILKFFNGDYDGFRECWTQSVNLLRKTASRYPDVTTIRFRLASTLHEFAMHEVRLKNHSRALALLDESADNYRSYLAEQPRNSHVYAELAAALILAGRSSTNLGDVAIAEDYFDQALTALDSAEDHPQTNPRVRTTVKELRAAID